VDFRGEVLLGGLGRSALTGTLVHLELGTEEGCRKRHFPGEGLQTSGIVHTGYPGASCGKGYKVDGLVVWGGLLLVGTVGERGVNAQRRAAPWQDSGRAGKSWVGYEGPLNSCEKKKRLKENRKLLFVEHKNSGPYKGGKVRQFH